MTTVGRLDQAGMLSVLAGVIGGLVVAAYVTIMVIENDDAWEQVIAWVLLMAAPSVLSFGSLGLGRQGALWTRLVATLLFAAFAVITSFGLGFWPAAALSGLAVYRTRTSPRTRSELRARQRAGH